MTRKRAFIKYPTVLAPWSQTPSLQNCENVRCWSHPVCGILSQQHTLRQIPSTVPLLSLSQKNLKWVYYFSVWILCSKQTDNKVTAPLLTLMPTPVFEQNALLMIRFSHRNSQLDSAIIPGHCLYSRQWGHIASVSHFIHFWLTVCSFCHSWLLWVKIPDLPNWNSGFCRVKSTFTLWTLQPSWGRSSMKPNHCLLPQKGPLSSFRFKFVLLASRYQLSFAPKSSTVYLPIEEEIKRPIQN